MWGLTLALHRAGDRGRGTDQEKWGIVCHYGSEEVQSTAPSTAGMQRGRGKWMFLSLRLRGRGQNMRMQRGLMATFYRPMAFVLCTVSVRNENSTGQLSVGAPLMT